ncbi:hypothetical protein [Streptomyces hokutonensis]|uniref:hypothetical protein n=1 Tax=Streptomyces hokutonensis TaxID=1306990 RepID=UPI0037FFF2C5
MKRRDIVMGLTAAAAAPAVGLATDAQASGAGGGRGGSAPLTIQEQDSFAVGGTVITTPGTFDPRNPTNPAGQTLYGDHAHVFFSMLPDTGPIDGEVLANGVSALFDEIGQGILVTHSHAGGFGWHTAMRNKNIKTVVALEPGSGFAFPEGDVPDPMPSSAGTLAGEAVPREEFQRLTKVPIVVYYGDNIPTEPTDIAGRDNWRVRLAMARLFVDALNRHGGDATLVHLPESGTRCPSDATAGPRAYPPLPQHAEPARQLDCRAVMKCRG